MQTIDWLIIGGLLALLLFILVASQKIVRSAADFLAANRCAGRYLLTVASGIGGIGAISIIAVFEQCYVAGFAPQWWRFINGPIGLLLVVSGWVYYRYRETRVLTLAQFFELRYSRNFRVFSGLLGWPLKVTISGATGFTWKFFWVGKEHLAPQPVPEALDYDLWLGPAPYKPYNAHRTHQTFRGYWDYDGGGLTDMGQHYMDPVQYLLGKDGTSPVKIEVDAPQQHPDAVGIWRKITYTYDDGCQIVLEGEGFESEGKVPYIEGPEGKVYKGFECTIPDIMNKLAELPDPEPQNTDFLDCVRTRERFTLDEVKGHRSSTLVNLGACALRLNRTLHFDPESQLFIGDDAANRLLDQPMRAPWKI